MLGAFQAIGQGCGKEGAPVDLSHHIVSLPDLNQLTFFGNRGGP